MPPDIGQGKAARKIAVAHLALARSQNTRAGVSGIHKKQSSLNRLLLWFSLKRIVVGRNEKSSMKSSMQYSM